MKSIYLGFAYGVLIVGIVLSCFSVIGLMHLRFQSGFAMRQAMEIGIKLHTSKEEVYTVMQSVLIENGLRNANLEIVEYEQYPNFLKGNLRISAFGYSLKMERTMVEELVQ